MAAKPTIQVRLTVDREEFNRFLQDLDEAIQRAEEARVDLDRITLELSKSKKISEDEVG